jgi:hypothetical protein
VLLDDLRVGVNADFGGDPHRVLRDGARVEVRVRRERTRGRQRERSAGSNPDDTIVRLDEIARAREQEHRALVEDDEHRFEAAQQAIAAPVLGQFDRRALEIAAVLFELRLEPREEGEGIGRRAGEAGQDAVVVETPDLARPPLDDRLPEGDLAVARQDRAVAVPDGENRGAWK